MNVFELTSKLIAIESITGDEAAVGNWLFDQIAGLAERTGAAPVTHLERIEVEPNRFNVFARFGDTPTVSLSTHMDTVPPFFGPSEDAEFIHGRGACDTKGIIASMICAAEELLRAGEHNFGLLFVVGEERNSAGAYHAAANPRGSRFIINGEPTENKLALGSKGAMRCELIARGRMAHSAYPELGESAIDKLVDALAAIRHMELPVDEVLGKSTLNVGVISGGRAPNVIADEARAELLIRLVGDSTSTKQALANTTHGLVEVHEILEIPALRLGSLPGFETCVVAYTTDIPAFGDAWGTPYLLGPGSIHVAHTLHERVPKIQLLEAVELYRDMVKRLKD